MICRACYSPDHGPLPFDLPAGVGRWRRCRSCGSDTAEHSYDPGMYTTEYLYTHTGQTDRALLKEQVRSNVDLFDKHAKDLPNRDFLDVGCSDGTTMEFMADRGWAVHGFDVAKPHYYGPHVTVGAVFSRWLFPLRYSAVLCREVLEHVENPDQLLHELHGVACSGGLVQVQTPAPSDYYAPTTYQLAHLCIISPTRLKKMLDAAMFDLLEELNWGIGQAYLCRAR